MLPVLLYLFTAFATALPVLWALQWAIWGAIVSPVQDVSLLGSLILVIAALLSMWRRRVGGRLALLGTVAVWCFYTPLVIEAASSQLTNYDKLGPGSFRGIPPASPLSVVLLIACALLFGTTVYAATISFKR